MFLVIGLMLSGILIGYLLRTRRFVKINQLITCLIWLLLFFLGVEVGGNERILNSLGTLGVEALLITLASVLGSCLAAWLLWYKLYKKGGGV